MCRYVNHFPSRGLSYPLPFRERNQAGTLTSDASASDSSASENISIKNFFNHSCWVVLNCILKGHTFIAEIPLSLPAFHSPYKYAISMSYCWAPPLQGTEFCDTTVEGHLLIWCHNREKIKLACLKLANTKIKKGQKTVNNSSTTEFILKIIFWLFWQTEQTPKKFFFPLSHSF